MRRSYVIFLLAVLLTGCGGSDSSNSASTNTSSNANADTTNKSSNNSSSTSAKMPEFPWPPDASAFTTIPSEMLAKPGTGAKLDDVDKRLTDALRKAGYEQTSYYHIPGGFVVAAQLEQFDAATGAPLAGPVRWSTKVEPPKAFTREYFRALIKGNVGHFRVIAFAITKEPFSETGKEINPSQASGMGSGGVNKLPTDVKEEPYTEDYQCTALIYEFLQPNSGPAQFVRHSGLLASQHLQKILSTME